MIKVTVAALAFLCPLILAQDCVNVLPERITVDVSETAEEGYFVVLDDSGIFTGRFQCKCF